MQQARRQEHLVFTRSDLGADELRAGRQDSGVLLVEVDAGHRRHVVDVIVISEEAEQKKQSIDLLMLALASLLASGWMEAVSPEGPAPWVTEFLLIGCSRQVKVTFPNDGGGRPDERAWREERRESEREPDSSSEGGAQKPGLTWRPESLAEDHGSPRLDALKSGSADGLQDGRQRDAKLS